MNDEIKEILGMLNFNRDTISNGICRVDYLISREQIIKLLDYITNLQQENKKLISENETIKNIKYTVDEVIYKSRNDKAKEKLKSVNLYGLLSGKTLISALINDVLDILEGDDTNEEK